MSFLHVLLIPLLLLTICTSFVSAAQREPGSVIQDLDQYQALYVRHMGCMWSEYGYANYDDDGENRDGDENWYQGRTTSFRANAAYSLYGIKKGPFSLWTLRKCSHHTYINTFITNNGADSILNVTGRLSSSDGFYNDDGHANCNDVDEDGEDDAQRLLGSGDGDNGNDMSTTMGCSLRGYKYAMAVFQGGYCDGKYFMYTAGEMKDYNRAMNKVRCEKIYDASQAYKKGVRVDTPADTLLEESSSCSNYMYDNRCPDPYGINKSYRKRSRLDTQMSLRVISWMAIVVGLVLMAAGYYARNRRWIRQHRRRMRRRMCSKDSGREQGTLPTVSSSSRRSSRGSFRKFKSQKPGPDRDGLVTEKKRSKKKSSSRRSKSRMEKGEDEL